MSGWVAGVRIRAVVTVALLACLVPLAPASADHRPEQPLPQAVLSPAAALPQVRDYRGPAYARAAINPTEGEPQSKLWFAQGSWWGLLVDTDAQAHIRELMPGHYWRDTGTTVPLPREGIADVLWTGRELFLVTAAEGRPLTVSRHHFDPGEDTWTVDRGFPVSVVDAGPAAATIAQDSTGRLWVTFVRDGRVLVAHSTLDQYGWTEPFAPPGVDTEVTNSDVSSIVAFDENIGVLWSDEGDDTFTFAVHEDRDEATVWSAERAASGFLTVDNHISLQTAESPSGTEVFAAVKTNRDEVPGVPATAVQIAVLERTAEGRWTVHPAGTVADGHTEPILAVDSLNDELYLIAQAGGNGLFYKRSALDHVTFPAGPGEALVSAPRGSVTGASSSKSPGTEESGLVVVANSPGTSAYFYAEIALQASPEDQAVPTTPPVLVAEPTAGCQVELFWSPATDDSEIRGYRLERDGQELTFTTATSFVDTTAQCGRTLRYSVTAEDASGNTSGSRTAEPVTLSARLDRAGIRMLGTSSSSGSGSTDHLRLPAPPVRAGDVVLASIDVSGNTSVTAPGGWQLVRQDHRGERLTKATFVRVVGEKDPQWYPFRLASAHSAVALAVAYRGLSTTNPVVQSAGQDNSPSNEAATPTISIDAAQETAVGFFGVSGIVSITPSAEIVSYMTQGVSHLAPRRVTGAIMGVHGSRGFSRAFVTTLSRTWSSIGQAVVLRAEQE